MKISHEEQLQNEAEVFRKLFVDAAGDHSRGEILSEVEKLDRRHYSWIREEAAKLCNRRVEQIDALVNFHPPIAQSSNGERTKEQKAKSTAATVPAAERQRIAKVAPPQKPISLCVWRDVIAKNFPSLLGSAEICLSVEAQLLLNDVTNPFALALVDVPASGKTITLNFFDGPPELTYTTDCFTAASFVSHATNVRREERPSVDLLPRIRYRTVIVRELGSIFGAKDDELIKSLGILTRVLDGEGLETDSGVHGRRGYTGDYLFNLLAGTTPIQPRSSRSWATSAADCSFSHCIRQTRATTNWSP